MIRRVAMVGFLSAFMVILFWDFYDRVIAYDPLKAIDTEETPAEENAKTHGAYRYAWGKEIEERNPFSRMRGFANSPASQAIVVEPEPEVQKPERPLLRLNGIIRNKFGEHVAFIYRNNTLLPPLRKGDSAEDIIVIGITEREVTLLWEDEEIKLDMAKIKTLKR